MLYFIPVTFLKVALNTIKLVTMFYANTNIVESGVKHQIKLATMFYAITNIVESGVKHQ